VDEAGEVQLGRQRSPKYQTGLHTHKYLRVANVFEDRLDLSDVLSMDFNEKDFERYRLVHGDILLNEGQSTELVGRPAMWRDEIENCCFQNTLVRFRAYREKVYPEYALGVFLDFLRRSAFARVSSKTSSVAHLGAARFAAMDFPLPPMELQKEYVVARKAIADALSSAEYASQASEDLFGSLVRRAFEGEL
jgi:type I restriction enzyme S subunit